MQEIIWAGQAFMKGSHGYSGLVWPLFFTGVYYLIFNGGDPAVWLGGEEAELFPVRGGGMKCQFWKSMHIEKHFDNTKVLEDISFPGTGPGLAIIGSSGSGKTTLLRCLNFWRPPDRGPSSVKGSVFLTPLIPTPRRRARYGKSASTSVWYSSPSISSPVHRPEECHPGQGAAGPGAA